MQTAELPAFVTRDEGYVTEDSVGDSPTKRLLKEMRDNGRREVCQPNFGRTVQMAVKSMAGCRTASEAVSHQSSVKVRAVVYFLTRPGDADSFQWDYLWRKKRPAQPLRVFVYPTKVKCEWDSDTGATPEFSSSDTAELATTIVARICSAFSIRAADVATILGMPKAAIYSWISDGELMSSTRSSRLAHLAQAADVWNRQCELPLSMSSQIPDIVSWLSDRIARPADLEKDLNTLAACTSTAKASNRYSPRGSLEENSRRNGLNLESVPDQLSVWGAMFGSHVSDE